MTINNEQHVYEVNNEDWKGKKEVIDEIIEMENSK